MLEVHGIDVFYGPIQALREVSLRVDAGEMVALVGANGAGKTTTLRTISGMLAPARGRILLDGDPVEGLPPYKVVERGVAHLPEGRELFGDLSVVDNLKLGNWPIRKRGELNDRLDRVMSFFPILRERRDQASRTLSGGEQQMLGVARALMSDPRVLLVDELSLGLAPKIVAQLFDILREVNAAGTAVLLVEQFVHMALENTHRAYVLVKGEVALSDRSDRLLDSPELMAAYLGEAAEAGTTGLRPADRGLAEEAVVNGRKRRTPPARTANARRARNAPRASEAARRRPNANDWGDE